LSDRRAIDGIWVGESSVDALPATVGPDQVIVIESGEVRIAIRPLSRTDLGRDAPIQLAERDGDLILELYNYLGPEKRFWELGWPGAFFQGTPHCGVYLEVAERDQHSDAMRFAREVLSGQLLDRTEPPFVYAGERERLWHLQYARDGAVLGIEVDLMSWRLKRRWTEDGDLGWPMLASPLACETRTGEVVVGEARLRCGPEAGWLFACPERNRWVAAYHGRKPAPLELSVPGGRLALDAMGTGTVVWEDGTVYVEAVAVEGTPRVEGGVLGSVSTCMEGEHGLGN
jgi:hypothetical protein